MTEIPTEMDYMLRYSLSQEENVICHSLGCPYQTTLETGTPACGKMIETTELDRDYVARLPEETGRSETYFLEP